MRWWDTTGCGMQMDIQEKWEHDAMHTLSFGSKEPKEKKVLVEMDGWDKEQVGHLKKAEGQQMKVCTYIVKKLENQTGQKSPFTIRSQAESIMRYIWK